MPAPLAAPGAQQARCTAWHCSWQGQSPSAVSILPLGDGILSLTRVTTAHFQLASPVMCEEQHWGQLKSCRCLGFFPSLIPYFYEGCWNDRVSRTQKQGVQTRSQSMFHQLVQKPNTLASAECFISRVLLNKFSPYGKFPSRWIGRSSWQPCWQGTGCLRGHAQRREQSSAAQLTSGHSQAPAALLLHGLTFITGTPCGLAVQLSPSPAHSPLPGTRRNLEGTKPQSQRPPSPEPLQTQTVS